MALSIKKTVTKCKSTGRVGTGAVKAIFLHAIEEDINNIVLDARNCCNRDCLSSVHYVVDVAGCVIHQFVPEADTAWGFEWIDPTLDPPACPPAAAACQPCGVCTIETTDAIFTGETPPLANLDPNAFVIHVALAMPVAQVPAGNTNQTGFTEDCDVLTACAKLGKCSYDTLVALLADIFDRFPLLTPSATTIRKKGCGLDCIDIAQLIIDINAVPAPVAPFSRLCTDLKTFAAGAPVLAFGTDIAGNCVQGPIAPTAAVICTQIQTFPVGAASAGPFLGTDCQFHPVTFPTDVFVASGAYNPATNILTLTLANGALVNIDMTTLLSDVTPTPASVCTALGGFVAGVAAVGDTKVVLNGGICKLVPDDSLCAQIALLAAGATTAATQLVGADCATHTPANIVCAALAGAVAGAVAVPGTTALVGADCQTHVLPDLCAQVNLIPVGVGATGDQVLAVNGGVCKLVPLSAITPGVAPAFQNHVSIPTQYFGVGNPTNFYLGEPRAWLTVTDASIPGGVGVIPVY